MGLAAIELPNVTAYTYDARMEVESQEASKYNDNNVLAGCLRWHGVRFR